MHIMNVHSYCTKSKWKHKALSHTVEFLANRKFPLLTLLSCYSYFHIFSLSLKEGGSEKEKSYIHIDELKLNCPDFQYWHQINNCCAPKLSNAKKKKTPCFNLKYYFSRYRNAGMHMQVKRCKLLTKLHDSKKCDKDVMKQT